MPSFCRSKILLALFADACAISRAHRIVERQLRVDESRNLAHERTNIMKISNAARLIFWVAAILALGILVRAESGQKRAIAHNARRAPLRIVDQNGRSAVSGAPSATSTTVDVQVGPGLAFSPNEVNISVG